MLRHLPILGLALCLAACAKNDADLPPGNAPIVADEADQPTPRFRNVGSETAFVGDAACFDCHEDLWRGYQQHGMARSYYRLTPENAVEDFTAAPVRHAATGFTYRVFAQDGGFFQEEYRLDASGEKTHRLVRRMDYVMGSGTAARTYLTEDNRYLYEMPLTWYTQARKWDFSPGYRERNTRFDRLIPDRCMACHNSYPETIRYVKGKYATVPEGIGCERCHGPGGLHVEERLASPEVTGEVDASIVNPAHLSLDRQLDVCQQCHLHTTVSVLREGRGPFDYRPSEPLAAHLSLFATDAPSSTDQISVISHADRMKQSGCFVGALGTAAPLTCVTCHDPHAGFRQAGPSYFNDTCLGCHAASSLALVVEAASRGDHVSSSDCIACHMPKVEAEDAPHASFTDHWIRVVGQEDAPSPLPAHGSVALTPYFEEDAAGPEARIYEGVAYVVYGAQQGDSLALEQGVSLLKEALAGQPDHGEAQFLMGLALYRLGRVEQAVSPLEEAVRLGADIPERLNLLAQAYEAGRRDPARIDRLYARALSIQPALAEVRVNYGRFLETQGRLDEAVDAYRQAAEEQPWLEVASYNLGTAYLQQGAFDSAEALLLQAVELKPDYPEALGNLGLLYAGQGRMAEARVQFEQAVAAAPHLPAALGNLGAYYLNEDDLPRAIDLLRRAVEADPSYLDGLVNLSLAYFRNDQPEPARVYAQKALDIDSSNALARQILDAL